MTTWRARRRPARRCVVGAATRDAIAARVRAHHDAGADHVCIYVFGGGDRGAPARCLAPSGTGLTSL